MSTGTLKNRAGVLAFLEEINLTIMYYSRNDNWHKDPYLVSGTTRKRKKIKYKPKAQATSLEEFEHPDPEKARQRRKYFATLKRKK